MRNDRINWNQIPSFKDLVWTSKFNSVSLKNMLLNNIKTARRFLCQPSNRILNDAFNAENFPRHLLIFSPWTIYA